MVKDVLVAGLVDAGDELLHRLDAAGIPVTAAFWLFEDDTRRWKLYIASPSADRNGSLWLYRQLLNYIPADGSLTLEDIAVVGTRNRLVKALRSAERKGPVSLVGQRWTSNTFDNVFFEDAYVYRVA